MMNDKNTIDAFFSLLKGGLWEQRVYLVPFSPIDADALYKLADEQSVVGLVSAGIEHVEDTRLTKHQALPFLKRVVSTESNNTEMNSFISWLWDRLKEEQVSLALVKGQGIAQCYERPQWRSAGDIDLLLDPNDYEKAKSILFPIAQSVHPEKKVVKHQGLTILSLTVELHGTLHTGLSRRLDSVVDAVQDEMFRKGLFRKWDIDHTQIFLPSPDCDVIFIFTHILQHFYKGGIGLRQICDLCRFLWTYKDAINRPLLMDRLQSMGIMREWRSFMAFAVEYLGLPEQVAPFYSQPMPVVTRRIASFVIASGNFGRSRDNSYREKGYPILIRKFITLWHQIKDNISLFRISPINSLRFIFGYILSQIEE